MAPAELQISFSASADSRALRSIILMRVRSARETLLTRRNLRPDDGRILLKQRQQHHRQVARTGYFYPQSAQQTARPRAYDQHLVPKQDRLRNAVRHEQNSFRLLLPDAHELHRQILPCERIE